MTTALQPDTPRTRARALWASGDSPDVARRFLPDPGAILVSAAGVRPPGGFRCARCRGA